MTPHGDNGDTERLRAGRETDAMWTPGMHTFGAIADYSQRDGTDAVMDSSPGPAARRFREAMRAANRSLLPGQAGQHLLVSIDAGAP
jgi:hypothetical protein